ncbi:two-component sensor histidine kinase [Bacillus sp. J14TS2]|uniref:sensor histidine kinase n=1 Tax=Bacillus sp. J14TS2 TaxID=2807188 RepID=UPI001B292ED1|nr:HAMP domain-containing sensor histidine kinase [Bacillus sp. J14TS2]GIN69556.1 two-component sensor histidine kinase [Bacillus sp. J14TS2]
MNIRTQFLITFFGSLMVIICSMVAIFWLLLFAINGEASSPVKLYKSVTQQKQITYDEQEALVTFRNIAKENPDDLLKANIQQSIDAYETKDLNIVIRKQDEIMYHSPDLVVKSLIVHAPKFDTENIYTQGTIDNKGSLYRYLKFDFHFSDNDKGSVMILRQENSFSEFLQRWGLIIITLILAIAIFLVFMFNRSLNKAIIVPLRELNRKVQKLKEGKLEGKIEVSTSKKGEVNELAQEFEKLREALNIVSKENKKYEENRKELLSNISHDLKTPITSIVGYVEGLKDGVADTPAKQDKYLNIVYNKAKNLNFLIDDLLVFSKLDVQKWPFSFEYIDLKRFLVHFVEEYQLDLEQKYINLTLEDIYLNKAIVRMDVQKIRRVLDNIIQNSIRYMNKDKKQIMIFAKQEIDEVRITIQDNGSGIAMENLEMIFDRFYRVENSRNSDKGGSGLGLAIARQIILEHGGNIKADSELGEGTSITFTLPLKENGYNEGNSISGG